MSDLPDRLAKALGSRLCSSLDYVELRAESTVHTAIDQRDSGVEVISRRYESGHSARVLNNGCWGFSVSDGFRDIQSTIRNAAKAASVVPPREGEAPAELCMIKPVQRHVRSRTRKPLQEIDMDEKISFLKEICLGVIHSDSRITTSVTNYRDTSGQKLLVTSEGTCVVTDVSLADLMTAASGRVAGRSVSSRDEVGTVTRGWDFFEKKETAKTITDRLVKRIQGQMNGIPAKRGTFPCILSPRVVGMLAHEALGHLAEADSFSTGAFGDLEGKRVAPENITILDSPSINDGFGNIKIDDEGVIARDAVLIRNGVLGEQMTDREWAARLGTPPTGNARAESYRAPPIIRMRNTYFARGDMSLDELLEGKKFGYYCVDVKGGQTETNSSFQVGIQECYEIRDGEISKPVRDLALSGIAVDSLQMIDGLGDDFEIESSYCGKLFQYMATSDGGPHMSLKKGAIVFGGSG